jgi:hypothetical protein
MSDLHKQAQQLAPHLNAWFPSFAGTRLLGRGTAFPSTDITIAAGDRFFRTDLGFECYYDGARWLTVQVVPMVLLPNRTTVAANTIWDTRVRTDMALYVEYYAISTNVAATNNGTNFWTITCQGVNLGLTAATTVYQPNTSADTAATETDHSGAVAAGSVAPANNAFLRVSANKTLTPGNLTLAVTAYTRLIVT